MEGKAHVQEAGPAGHPLPARRRGRARPARLRRAPAPAGRPAAAGADPGGRGDGRCDHHGARRAAEGRHDRAAAGEREDDRHLLGRLRSSRPRGRQGTRHRRQQHARRADRRHRGHHPALPAGRLAPRLGGPGHAAPPGVGRLEPAPAHGLEPGRQAAGHRRHGPHRPRRGRARPRLRHEDPLPQPLAPAARARAGRDLLRRRRGDAEGQPVPVAERAGLAGDRQLPRRQAHRPAAGRRHRGEHRARHPGGRRSADRRPEQRHAGRRRPRRLPRRAQAASGLPAAEKRLPAAAPGQRHGGDAQRHGLLLPGQPRRLLRR